MYTKRYGYYTDSTVDYYYQVDFYSYKDDRWTSRVVDTSAPTEIHTGYITPEGLSTLVQINRKNIPISILWAFPHNPWAGKLRKALRS